MFRKLTKIAPFAFAFAPMMALAQGLDSNQGLLQGDSSNIETLFDAAADVMNYIVVFIIALAVIFFLVSLVKYILKAGNEADQKAARSSMVWGIVIIAVMVSVWGLVEVLQGAFGVDSDTAEFQTPDIPTPTDYNPI